MAKALAGLGAVLSIGAMQAAAAATLPAQVELASGWQLQDAAKVKAPGATISVQGFPATGWYTAVVPGTVLTSLVKDGVYPEPLYGENNRPQTIPESLNKTPYWYRTTVKVPRAYRGKQIWLNFAGINFTAEVWVNGIEVGTIRGAFTRGVFDISSAVRPGQIAVVAVEVHPQPHPGVPHEHTIANGVGKNGGITAIDGPTFLSTIGWDWLAAVRDRDTGIWQKVFLSATGIVRVENPLVTTDLPLPRTDSSDVSVTATVRNTTNSLQQGVLEGSFGDVHFERAVHLGPQESKLVTFDAKTTPAMHVLNPKLWWPNGYGPQNLYKLDLKFVEGRHLSDETTTQFGIRKITYTVPDTDNLTISVNGVRVFIRGGDWGLDEAMKRIPRERLEAEIRMHQMAGMNLIRNWVGQSTGEDFYELCDQYGILLWDEFFQPNPSDGPNPDDLTIYMANVREKILRYRNHPSIAVWCARNEGYPPKAIDDRLRVLMAELEPTRLYQPSSTAGHGVHSAGPYHWRTPQEFYLFENAFKTEIGSMSVPTLESIHGMMPEKDWEHIDDDWAQHDFAKGAQQGDKYPAMIAARYGSITNLADFVQKAQLANYEAFRAMYEGRNAKMFKPATAVITWMSNPAQPSFVWQLYHYDLEPNASLFGVEKASEMVHVQWNESTGQVEIVNNKAEALSGATVESTLYNLDGTVAATQKFPAEAAASEEKDLGALERSAATSPVYFIRLELKDASGAILSRNFYWHEKAKDDLTALHDLKPVTLTAKATRSDAAGRAILTVTLENASTEVALMTHLQLRRKATGERVLPVFYSDNYLSLAPGESRTVTIDAALADLKGDVPMILLDGWNVLGATFDGNDVGVGPNVEARADHWPETGLPMEGATTK